jgi:FkbH-like protein
MPGPSIVVSATFTADTLKPVLAFWMAELGFDYRIEIAPYNQVFQLLLDPAGALALNPSGFNVILVRFEDWARTDPADPPDFARLDSGVHQLLAALHSAAQAFRGALIVCVCPASPAFLSDPRAAERQHQMEARLSAEIDALQTVHLLRPREIEDLYPVRQPHDSLGDKLGRVPYTAAYYAALGTMLARRIHTLCTPPYKVIALDCDDTLWHGICGEDGPQGVTVDAPRRFLQGFMAAQQAAGMLLCLCSKNNVEDVLDTFRLQSGMPLHLDHFVAWRINWSPKPVNLASLAEELELGLDSFILVDDSPKECREVEAGCPQMLSLSLPARDEEIPDFLRHTWVFDHLRVTEEDRSRPQMYTQELERQRASKHAASLADFLQGLQLDVRIAPVTPQELTRVSQLTQRTNQMNFTTLRRSESDLEALLAAGNTECLTVQVSDRFGSYGLVGVLILRDAANALEIDTFLLSCRALGRGVEHRMLAAVGEIARERGLGVVDARFVRSSRNRPALLFLESVGLPYQAVCGDSLNFRFPADFAVNIQYEPRQTAWPSSPTGVAQPAAPRRNAIPYARIANELRDVARIVEYSGAGLRARDTAMPLAAGAVPARTDLERQLCRIWSEMLGVHPVGIEDNFFDLGGHSLLAVQLLSRLKDELGLELLLDVVYGADFTIAELAKAIELREMEMAAGDQYAALLAEIESLSDDEVREQLARETGEALH